MKEIGKIRIRQWNQDNPYIQMKDVYKRQMQDWTFANDNGSCPQMKNAAGYVER